MFAWMWLGGYLRTAVNAGSFNSSIIVTLPPMRLPSVMVVADPCAPVDGVDAMKSFLMPPVAVQTKGSS